jgi:hypothetical protein
MKHSGGRIPKKIHNLTLCKKKNFRNKPSPKLISKITLGAEFRHLSAK